MPSLNEIIGDSQAFDPVSLGLMTDSEAELACEVDWLIGFKQDCEYAKQIESITQLQKAHGLIDGDGEIIEVAMTSERVKELRREASRRDGYTVEEILLARKDENRDTTSKGVRYASY